MRTTVCTCDVCKQSKSESDLAHFRISLLSGGLVFGGISTGSSSIDRDICSDCLKKKGLLVEPKSDAYEDKISAKDASNQSFKEKFIDLLTELDVSFIE